MSPFFDDDDIQRAINKVVNLGIRQLYVPGAF